ncbi:NAD(P)/FAD-dependent oxidoreductase [Rhizobium sp. SAFR-030]|uniref:NAD(P)/FAD-dependent oxidoreductase n=1 Tax=Rhizobium sp. SAFR-030 TaxID=3387277 RepID=UPI003F7DB53E
MTEPRIAIIGAGIAGLSAADRLLGIAAVTVIEKSRGVGGRMATRRSDGAAFDHGAQYFTIRDARFHAAMHPLLDAGVIEAWNVPLSSIDETGMVAQLADRAPRFVGVPTMTAIAKAMTQSLDLRLGVRVLSLTGDPGRWHLETDSGRLGPFDWVVSAAPAPQTFDLLPLADTDREAVAGVRMNGCFTLMIRLGTEAVPVPAASRVDHPVISWIAANNTKPGRDPETCLVVHADNRWSEDHLQDPPEIVKQLIFSSFRQLFPQLNPDKAVSLELHRWRFANVAEPLGRPFLIDTDRRIAACGDWCIGNRVEAAFLSGLELGERLRTDISSERR